MDLFEHQAKELFAKYGVAVPRGKVAWSPDEAEAAAAEVGGT
ncbi:MAG TPA: ATP-grasp domain-containing protein, partial [Actinomycetota bacterium]|nr:ATP-grasp domain-containing protein [Actinomycetota bacterium]